MKLTSCVLSLFIGCSSMAFTLNSSTNPNFKGWPSHEIKFNLNTVNCPAGMDVEGLMNTAFAVWNDVPSSNVHLSIAGTTTSTTTAAPTTVYCEPNFQSVTGADQDYVPAAASLSHSGDYASGGLFYLNVSAGLANISGFDSTKLSIIVAHEIGHILGLGHSQDSDALMYYNGTLKTSLHLSQDDVDGVTYLYPRSELGADKPMGCALVKGPVPPSGGGWGLLAMLLPLCCWAYLRSRQVRHSF